MKIGPDKTKMMIHYLDGFHREIKIKGKLQCRRGEESNILDQSSLMKGQNRRYVPG